jgi:hypothetical protein
MVIGQEITIENNIPHLQGYVEFTNATTWEQVRQRFITTIGYISDLQISKGDQESNIKYCTKGGDYSEHGTKVFRMAAEDIAANVVSLMQQGQNLIYILTTNKIYSTYIVRNFKSLSDIEMSIKRQSKEDKDAEEGDLPF